METPTQGQVWNDATGKSWKIESITGAALTIRRLNDNHMMDVVVESIEHEQKVAKGPSVSSNQQMPLASYYSGDTCPNTDCGSMRMRRAGTCLFCEDCGETTGCG